MIFMCHLVIVDVVLLLYFCILVCACVW